MKLFFFIGGMILFFAIAAGRSMLGGHEPPAPAAATTPVVLPTPATPLPTPTLAPVTGEPIRVNFQRGAWGETLTGGTSTKYLLWAAQGQTFTTTLASKSTALVSLYGPDGKPLYEQLAAGYTAAAKLPANGDYALEVRTSGAYTVGVEIR